MARENKVHMPATTAGLTRYFDDYKSKIEFRPAHVIVFAIIIMVIVILMHLYGGAFLGI